MVSPNKFVTSISDEFELKFPELSQAELGISQFSSWNRADFMYINKKQIFVKNYIRNFLFCTFIMIKTN